MTRKRRRQASPQIRLQVSRPTEGPSTGHTQVNSHVHVGIHTSSDPRSRVSVRTAHTTRPMEVVDLSGLLVDKDAAESYMVEAEFDQLSAEDTSHLAFGVDDEVIEDPDAGVAEEEVGDTTDRTREPVGD